MQPTTLVDLERLAKRGEAIAKSLEKSRKRSHSLREAKQLQFMISREFDAFKKQALERKQKPHLDLLEDYEQMMDVATGYEDWCDTMRSQFQSIANSSKIDYSLYTMIDREKVYFVRASRADADE